jgi:hypothetical protein
MGFEGPGAAGRAWTGARRHLLPAVLLGAAACAGPEERAVAFLAAEVRAWPAANRCYSCHNNGDAARALFAARRAGLPFETDALDATLDFLSRPERWKHNGPDGEFNDLALAALQFAFALNAAAEAGAPLPAEAPRRAAELLLPLQDGDGSWSFDRSGLPGSPVAYGRALATVAARRVLAGAGLGDHEAAGRADAWLARQRPANVTDAASLLFGETAGPAAERLDLLRRGQSPDGGWGPYVQSPPEVFDTALALLALHRHREADGIPGMIRRGRAWLTAAQERDGGWPGTTRPSGTESYAHRISTSGWAALALLQTAR